MQSLTDALAELRNSLEAALGSPSSLEPARASVELAVARVDGRWVVAEAGSPAGSAPHRITVELVRRTSARDSTEPTSSVSLPAPAGSVPGNADLLATLSQVFGAPGFDSSARATVFRETLEDLDEAEARAAISATAQSASTGDLPPRIARAAHLIGRLLERGPAGPETARRLLLETLAAEPVTAVREFVLQNWKTQDDWIQLD